MGFGFSTAWFLGEHELSVGPHTTAATQCIPLAQVGWNEGQGGIWIWHCPVFHPDWRSPPPPPPVHFPSPQVTSGEAVSSRCLSSLTHDPDPIKLQMLCSTQMSVCKQQTYHLVNIFHPHTSPHNILPLSCIFFCFSLITSGPQCFSLYYFCLFFYTFSHSFSSFGAPLSWGH